MGIKKLTPTSPARRYQTYLTRDELTPGAEPEKSLLEPKRRIFFGSGCDQSRACGPWTLPPPFQSGERIDATRARPVPFCFQSFLPEPATSPRTLVLCVPERRPA